MTQNRRIGMQRYIAPHPSYGWYVRTLAIFALLGGLVLGGASWLHQQQMLNALGLEQIVSDPDALKAQSLNMLVFSVTLSGIAFSCFVLVVGAFFFHRVAGPVYRIKSHMLELLDDKPARPLTLRKQDQLQDVAEVYNQLLTKLGALPEQSQPRP